VPRVAPRQARTLAFAALTVLLLVAGGVGAAPRPRDDSSPTGPQTPTQGLAGDQLTVKRIDRLNLAVDLLQGKPIVRGDFADPFVLAQPAANYAYATNTDEANVPVMRFPRSDQSIAQYLGDALPTLPAWTTKGFQWAPAVLARPGGRFVLYYSTPAPGGSGRKCISRAVGDNPAGPFADDSAGPFVCPLSQGGAIDPSPFVDTDGTAYLLWKSDGNCCSLPTDLFIQPLSADGTSTTGPPTKLATADQAWEGDLVEAPAMVRNDGRYYLFYSANNWDSDSYAVGVATCTEATGPCTKPLEHAWFTSTTYSQGPGGQEFFPASGGVWMVHHGWLPGQAGTPGGQRRLYLDLLAFDGADGLPTRVGAEHAIWFLVLVGAGAGAVVALFVGTAVWVRRRRHRSGGTAAA